jgi:hypothetical protein
VAPVARADPVARAALAEPPVALADPAVLASRIGTGNLESIDV